MVAKKDAPKVAPAGRYYKIKIGQALIPEL
jgi:hypothetical protein